MFLAVYLYLKVVIAPDLTRDERVHELDLLLGLVAEADQVLPLEDQVQLLILILRLEVHQRFQRQVLSLLCKMMKLAEVKADPMHECFPLTPAFQQVKDRVLALHLDVISQHPLGLFHPLYRLLIE